MENNFLKDITLKEFDAEMATTRKILELVPFAEKKDWRPHPKSSPMGQLATHVAILPGLVADIINNDSFVFGTGWTPPKMENVNDLLAAFEDKKSAARAALEGTDDAHLMGDWQFLYDDGTNKRELYKGPRIFALHSFWMNHMVHHRAQLGVYLRLNDIVLPGSYGPSADEEM